MAFQIDDEDLGRIWINEYNKEKMKDIKLVLASQDSNTKRIHILKLRIDKEYNKMQYIKKKGEECTDEYERSQFYDVLINEIQNYLDFLITTRSELEEIEKAQSMSEDKKIKSKEFTLKRQVLAILYILERLHIGDAEVSSIARFMEFLTGKNYKNIYDTINDLKKNQEKADIKVGDIEYVANHFQRLNLFDLSSYFKTYSEDVKEYQEKIKDL